MNTSTTHSSGNDHSGSEILTVKEVAALCRVSPKTIYGAIRRNEFPSSKIGGTIRCYRPDIIEWLRGNGRVLQSPRRNE